MRALACYARSSTVLVDLADGAAAAPFGLGPPRFVLFYWFLSLTLTCPVSLSLSYPGPFGGWRTDTDVADTDAGARVQEFVTKPSEAMHASNRRPDCSALSPGRAQVGQDPCHPPAQHPAQIICPRVRAANHQTTQERCQVTPLTAWQRLCYDGEREPSSHLRDPKADTTTHGVGESRNHKGEPGVYEVTKVKPKRLLLALLGTVPSFSTTGCLCRAY